MTGRVTWFSLTGYPPEWTAQVDSFRPGRQVAESPRLRSVAKSAVRLRLTRAPMIDRKWTGAFENKGSQAGEIEQDDLVSDRTELRPALADLHEPHGEETVRQMYREQGSQQYDRHRQAYDRYEGTDQHAESADQFDQGRQPGEQRWHGYAERVENDCKSLWPARQFREAVRHKSVTDDQAKWKGRK